MSQELRDAIPQVYDSGFGPKGAFDVSQAREGYLLPTL